MSSPTSWGGTFRPTKTEKGGFWGKEASEPVGWRYLVEMAELPRCCRRESSRRGELENGDRRHRLVRWPRLAIGPGRRAAFQGVGRSTTAVAPHPGTFTSRVSADDGPYRTDVFRTLGEIARETVFELPTAGEVALAELPRDNAPTALVFLDACRLDLGWRLAGLLNQGEPRSGRPCLTAVAPIPSITPLGMSFALPIKRDKLHVDLLAVMASRFTFTIDGFDGDLKWAEQRRKWLKQNLDVKDWLEIEEVLDGENLKKPGRSRKPDRCSRRRVRQPRRAIEDHRSRRASSPLCPGDPQTARRRL